MKKQEAIELLKNQVSKLGENKVDFVWVTQTSSLIRKFLGEDSDEYKFISNFKPAWTIIDYDRQVRNEKENKSNCTRFVEGAIETILINGLYKKPKTNFLQRWDNTTLVTVILFAIAAVFAGGTILGKYESDVQNFELKQDKIKLEQELEAINERCT